MQDDKKRIERLERHLYSRSHENPDVHERSSFEAKEFEVPGQWQSKDGVDELLRRERLEAHEGSVFKKLLFGAIAFFVLSLGIAAFMFLGGGNRVSSDNIDIRVFGPTTVGGGEELSLEIIIANKNNADLEGVNLQIEYPPGTRVAGNITEELLRQRESIGNIGRGGEARKVMRSVLFGEKESIKELTLTLEYRIKGSSALFFKDKKYELAIKSSPIIAAIDYPKEVTSGQDMDFVISITSNSQELLRNLLFRAEYPFGFSFLSSDPVPIEGNTVWRIGDLPPGDKRTLRIKGRLEGQNEEERTFRFSSGIESVRDQNQIAADFIALSETVTIKKPFLDLAVSLSGSTASEYVARPGEKIQANIVWTNNLPAPVLDASIEVKLGGAALDRNSVTAIGSGFYRSADNTVLWDKSISKEFTRLEPGARGAVAFSFAPLAAISPSSSNQDITLSISMKGSQILEGNRPQAVTSAVTRLVKISTNLSLAAKALHSVGPLENSGPIPPRADETTTYTVVWTVGNSSNDITDARVRATLPTYVSWNSLSTPTAERISYDGGSREVVWTLGDVRAGTGFTSSPREVSFQVALLPSLSQIGTVPVLMNEARVSGLDRFTGRQVEFSRSALTTRISSDPGFKEGDEVVAR